METKDFDEVFLKVFFIDILDYNEIFLEIHNNDQIYDKKCILFRLPINEDFKYSVDIVMFIKKLLIKETEYKIKILKDKRKNTDNTKELIMMYSNDLKINFNDVILKQINFLKEQENFRAMISNIKKRKKN